MFARRRVLVKVSLRLSKGGHLGISQFGPDSPHPLSDLSTELVWDGKYDEFGHRRGVDIVGLTMPFQKIETIDEPRVRLEAQGGLFDVDRSHLDDFRNMLIWGDNKLVMASLLAEFRGRIDLIYIDPPFDVGEDFTMKVPIGDKQEKLEKDQSALEVVAWRDTWGKGTDSYIHMMYERLVLMKELLSETGSIYVHVDWHVNHFIRLLLDEIFGEKNFVNEIVWHYRTFQGQAHSYFARKHDTLFLYSKSAQFTYNEQFDTEFEDTIDSKRWAAYLNDEHQIVGANMPTHDSRFVRYLNKWKKTHDREPGPDDVVFEVRGQPIDSVWDMKGLDPKSLEKVGYSTQKPRDLLERALLASSNPGDLVADFFCGSGTTGEVAERLNRRWIMTDLGRFAIHTSRKRLIEAQRQLHEEDRPYRAFDVFNLGRYERQWWQRERLDGADGDHRRVVLEFFKAEVLHSAPSPLIHGRKGTSLCHVDGIDSILTANEVRAVAMASQAVGAKEVICLSWEFEMDLRLQCDAIESDLGIRIKLIQIPREIMERVRKEPPPFLEVALLEAEPRISRNGKSRQVDIALTRFLPALAEVPTRELEIVQERVATSAFDFIDFWAVDFEYVPGQPFKHQWQDYRLRTDRSLKTVSEQRHEYPASGPYLACVKVIDVFGGDTSVTVPVKV